MFKGASWSSLGRLSTPIVIDEFLFMVAGCALKTDVYHWMFLKKVNMVQGQQDGPLRSFIDGSQSTPTGYNFLAVIYGAVS